MPEMSQSAGNYYRHDALTSICLWLACSLVVGAVMWPVSKAPLECYLRSYDLDIIAIGGIAAGFSWLLRLKERPRSIAIAAILAIVGTADYYHVGGSDLWGLLSALLLVLIPVMAYVWLVDPSPVFNVSGGELPLIVLTTIRRALRKSPLLDWLTEPVGGTLVLLAFSVAVVLLVTFVGGGHPLPWTGRCTLPTG